LLSLLATGVREWGDWYQVSAMALNSRLALNFNTLKQSLNCFFLKMRRKLCIVWNSARANQTSAGSGYKVDSNRVTVGGRTHKFISAV